MQEKLGTRRADGSVVGAEAGGDPLNEADLDGSGDGDQDGSGSVPLAATSSPVVTGQPQSTPLAPPPKQP